MTHTVPTSHHGNTAHPLISPGFGGRLMRARLNAGFDSQPKLARVAGLSVNTVCRHETEAHPPSLAAIVSYCRVLGVSAAYLQYGLGDPTVPPAVQHFLCSYKGLLLLPETRARMVAMPWSLIVDGEPTEPQVHAIARVVDANLRAREHRPDDELPRGDGRFPGRAGTRYEPSGSGEAATA